MYCAWISLRSKIYISRSLAAAASSLVRMTWMTSSMFSSAMIRPSTRCSRASRLARRNSMRRPDDLDPEVDVDLQQLAQPEHAGLAVDQRHVVDAERLFHRGQPVQLVQHRLGHEAGPDLDDQAQAVVHVGEVLEVGHAVQLPGLHQVLDPGDDPLRADAVGQLGDDDADPPRRELLDPGRGPGAEDAAAGLVGLPDPVQADDLAAGRQVGAGHEPHQRLEVGVRVGDQVPGGRDDLAEVVRGHVGRHPDGDAGRAVDQQVRERGREHVGLGQGAVVVRDEVDGVLVERVRHLQRGRRPSAPRCSASRPADRRRRRAEVAVPVDQRQPHRPRLGHPDQRVVDGAVAVRVQPSHHLADHLGALDVGAVGPQAHLAHLVEDAALHRLEAVPGVRQGALVDHRVGVLEVTGAHLVGDVDIDDVFLELGVVDVGAVAARTAVPRPRPAAGGRCRGASGHAVIVPSQRRLTLAPQRRAGRAAQVAEKPPSTRMIWPVT